MLNLSLHVNWLVICTLVFRLDRLGYRACLKSTLNSLAQCFSVKTIEHFDDDLLKSIYTNI